jgi:alpha-1,6-mannosyltransferase
VRIVRVANFVTARSGGLRTALRELGAGYQAAGHEAVLVVPGGAASDSWSRQGRVIEVPGPVVPGSGGYRVLLGRRRLAGLLADLAPDRLEVSDRATLRWTGGWARRQGVPAVMVSHESLDGLMGLVRGVPLARRVADALNARTAAGYDRVVCTTGWAEREFTRVGAGNVTRVPLGVDLDLFHPARRSPSLRRRLAAGGEVLLVHCGRLSVEKRPGTSLRALAELRAAGVPAVLVVVGDGPLRSRLVRRAAGLPVRVLGFLPDRRALARLLATADVVLQPGPVETFGLAALEALACGTPVVVNSASALPEVVGPAGAAVPGDRFADGVRQLLDRPEPARRAAARDRASLFDWPTAVAGFLTAHGLPVAELAEGEAEESA